MKTLRPRLFTQIFLLTLFLLGFGLIMIYSASVAEALRDFGTKWYFVLLQLKWAVVGIILMMIVSRIPVTVWEKMAPLILIGGLLLLIMVVIPGIGSKVQGARRWLVLPFMTIQPSELIKLVEVIYLSSWLTKKKINIGQFLAFLGVVGGLIMLEPDMGTAIVVSFIAGVMYFLSGQPVKNLIVIASIGVLMGGIFVALEPYRLARLTTFLDPGKDPLGSSYHIHQVILGLGSGGISGLGIGRSRQKYEYLPESTTDSIFAVVGEELGFIGGVALISVFVYLLSLIFKIATHARHEYASNLAAGIGSWIAAQVLLNLAAMVALTPLTGVPLPLVSYGGSALIMILVGIGVVLSIAREEKI
jgi:cell division protein FtsW